jgi:hypothetical protein
MTRSHDVSQLTTAGLELTRRQLRANLALITHGSHVHVPILAYMQAIDAELAGRTGNQQAGQASTTTARTSPARRPHRATRRANCAWMARLATGRTRRIRRPRRRVRQNSLIPDDRATGDQGSQHRLSFFLTTIAGIKGITHPGGPESATDVQGLPGPA